MRRRPRYLGGPGADAPDGFHIVVAPDRHDWLEALFLRELGDALPIAVRSFEWATSATRFDGLSGCEQLAADTTKFDLTRVVARFKDCLFVMRLTPYGRVAVSVAGTDRTTAQAVDHLQSLFPPAESKDRSMEFTFWTAGDGGNRGRPRDLDVCSWEDISSNYRGPTGASLDGLVAGFEPSIGGQLLLWHGPPGTGKTRALQALAWEWRSWCDFDYIVDPESFFGDANYMLDVLLHRPPRLHEDKRWRLVILEDTGELISADAKVRSGQGLSRLLNLTDGLIGQGLRVLVLITTNEELGALHEAVARPGRCAARVEFEPFTQDEAHAWFEANGHSVNGTRLPVVLADMYARLRGADVPVKQQVGFTSSPQPTKPHDLSRA